MENPKLEPDGFDNRLVAVNGVLPGLPSLADSGGSNSRYCRNLFSSWPEMRDKTTLFRFWKISISGKNGAGYWLYLSSTRSVCDAFLNLVVFFYFTLL